MYYYFCIYRNDNTRTCTDRALPGIEASDANNPNTTHVRALISFRPSSTHKTLQLPNHNICIEEKVEPNS